MGPPKGLDAFFMPRGIAVIGASAKQGSMGYQVLFHLTQMGFGGGIHPVNPKADEILGFPCHADINAIDAPVDLIVLLLKAEACGAVADAIARRRRERGDAGAVVVGSAGFAELATEEGVERQRYLADTLTSAGVRVIGPNCVGVVDLYRGVNTTFTAPPGTRKGGVSIISQSGAFATAYLRWGKELGLLGVSKFISVGNMADVTIAEMLDYLKDDDSTNVIFLYLEGVTDARGLMETAARVTRRKPIVAIKSGRTAMGSKVAQSHTSSIAGDPALYSGAFEQAGVIQAESVAELFHTTRSLDKQPLPKGNRVCVVTVVGGPSIICVDKLFERGWARMAPMSETLKAELRKHLSASATIGKPEGFIDMTASVTDEMHYDVLSLLVKDDDIDGIIFLTTPPGYSNEESMSNAIIRAYNCVPEEKRKPLLTVLISGSAVNTSRKILETANLPTFEYPDDAAVVMSDMIQYAEYRRRLDAERAAGEGGA